ncbi:acyl-CoA dehydrogenase family protein [Pseudoteredinibacter isoporae]|uniref:acyl-CoA dehydrogenase family protein n=1 Tax=Pseudoteredinibacter isoporae TaxID=570281 RepID=UPI003105B3E8
MNFDFSEEQQMLKDSVARFVQDEYDFEARNKVVANEAGFSQENWQKFAELGWLSIPFSETLGGFGGGATDTMVVMEELGKGLVAEPFIASVLMFGGLLQSTAQSDERDALIGGIIEGSVQGAVAYAEPQSRFEMQDVRCRAEQDGDAYRLSGEKSLVLNAMSADKIIVSARVSGEQSDEQGIALFLVDANAEGLSKTSLRTMDAQVVANIALENVTAIALCGANEGLALLKQMRQQVIVALAAEALGIMEKLNATTLEYCKTRKQFGVAIGSFQALQHRMVDTFMASEQCKSLLYRAVCSIEQGEDVANIEKNVLALKVMVGKAGKLIGGEAIQLHGGMGMTDELDVGHYVRRLLTINAAFGDADYQQQRFAELSLAS